MRFVGSFLVGLFGISTSGWGLVWALVLRCACCGLVIIGFTVGSVSGFVFCFWVGVDLVAWFPGC